MKKLFICLLFLMSVNIGYGQVLNETQKLIPALPIGYYANSVSIYGNKAIVGAYLDHENGTTSGAAYIFEFNGTNWIQTEKLMAIDGQTSGDGFGYSVAICGNLAVIGAPLDNENGSNGGAAFIFEFNGTTWVQIIKLMASDGWSGERFGKSVAISGNRVIVGSPESNEGGISSGSAFIYDFNGTTWVESFKLVPSDPSHFDEFGISVSVDSNRVVIGSHKNDDNGSDAGAAYIFDFNGTNWIQKAKLVPNDGNANQDFGFSVSIHKDRTIIGAQYDDEMGLDAGAAYTYYYNGISWILSSKILSNDIAAGDEFGYSVSIFNNQILVGSRAHDEQGSFSGAAYSYLFNGANWSQTAKLLASDGYQNDAFGRSVSLFGNFALVGSNDGLLNNAYGKAYIFDINNSYVIGNIFNDINANCIKDPLESGIPNRTIIIDPGNLIVQTDIFGNWRIDSLPIGNYTATLDTNSIWESTCNYSIIFDVTQTDSTTVAPFLGIKNTFPCARPSTSIYMPIIRRCFSNQNIYIRASNESIAGGILNSGYLDLVLDNSLTPTSASLSYSNLGNNTFRFNLLNNSLYPGEFENFMVTTSVSCDAILGQSLCIQANLYPADSCVFDTIPADVPGDFTPCSLPWDKSSISVDGWCENDSVYFTITNTGDLGGGDMECYSPIRLFIDGEYIWLDSILLLGGDTDTLVFSGDGRTWRLEVDQHPLHPGNSHPNATIELCGNDTNWTSNLVNILPLDDADPIVDIYCGVVTGSYDPNDKTGYPLGVTDSHYVSPNGKLEYVIRFQNTGTDTAFTVIVRDTLDMDLNIFSVVSGASSHNYSFRMYGPRILEWYFENILLPDSTTDEPGSNGFVSFEVKQMPNLPDGTEINNEVGIYFDFNDPIITNTTSHIIHRDIISPSWTQQMNIIDTACFNYSYNNFTYSNSGEYLQINEDTLVTLNIFISSLIVEAGQDLEVCFNEIVVLNANGALNYSWDNGITNGANFNATTSEMYHVTGTDIHGCQNSDSLYISVYDTIPQVDFTYSFNEFEITLVDSSSNDVNAYYWTIDGDSLSNQNTVQYLFTQNGSYEICLIASNDCFRDTTCQQIDITTIGIDDLNSSSGFKIYPNPTHSNFTIEISELNNSPFEITDITGKIIYIGILKDKLTNVYLHDVGDGIYLLRMNETTIKLVKN